MCYVTITKAALLYGVTVGRCRLDKFDSTQVWKKLIPACFDWYRCGGGGSVGEGVFAGEKFIISYCHPSGCMEIETKDFVSLLGVQQCCTV